jgi:RES domain-containing protein
MVNIRETMQAVYQRVASKSGPGAKIHRGRWNPSRLSGPQL